MSVTSSVHGRKMALQGAAGPSTQRTGARTSRSTASSQQSARAKNAKIVRLCKTLIVCRLLGRAVHNFANRRRAPQHGSTPPGRGGGNDSFGPAPCAILATTQHAICHLYKYTNFSNNAACPRRNPAMSIEILAWKPCVYSVTQLAAFPAPALAVTCFDTNDS